METECERNEGVKGVREIKFRVWDKLKKRYVQDEDYYCIESDGTLSEIDWNETCRKLNPDDFEVELYTGLRDLSGKEIYEGDIHTFDRMHFAVRWGHFVDDDSHSEMYGWHVGDSEGSGRLDASASDYINIVGNIRENPELLEVIK